MIDGDGLVQRRALLVEDDESVRRSLQLLLHWRGYDVRSYANSSSLLAYGGLDESDLLLADYRLPDGTGIEVLDALRHRGWSGRAVLITAFSSPGVAAAAYESGFCAVLEKPLRQQQLMAALGS